MTFTRRTILAVAAAGFAACSALSMPAFAQDKGLVGIAMPTKSSLRWISDGELAEGCA